MLLQRLNMDNTWLIGSGDTRLLVDPWLGGEQIDGASWFSAQRHKTAPVPLSEVPKYDAVLITQPYSDHCHPGTLSALSPGTIVAPTCVAKTLKRTLPDAETRLMAPNAAPIQVGALSLRVLKSSSPFAPQFQAIHLSDEVHSIVFAPHSLKLTKQSPPSVEMKKMSIKDQRKKFAINQAAKVTARSVAIPCLAALDKDYEAKKFLEPLPQLGNCAIVKTFVDFGRF